MEKFKTTVTLPKQAVDDAKVKAIREGTSLSAVMSVFIQQWIDGELATPEEAKAEGKDAPAEMAMG